jgi:hypothetical protein
MGQTHFDCTVATAEGSTVETLIGTITLSSKAKKIVGVWATCLGGDTLTSTEAVTGICRLDSDSMNLAPFKFPLDQFSMLTGGSIALPAHIIPVDIPAVPLAQINAYITIDDTTTGALKCRVGLMYEE